MGDRRDRYGNSGRWELHEHGGVQLVIILGLAQAAVYGIHETPTGHRVYDYGLKRPTIRFSLSKTPKQMASEVVRRLLPTVRDDARKLSEALWRHELRTSGRLRTLRSAQGLLGGSQVQGLSWTEGADRGCPLRYERASAYDLAGLHVTIEFAESAGSADQGAVTISRLTHGEVLTVVETIAALINCRRETE